MKWVQKLLLSFFLCPSIFFLIGIEAVNRHYHSRQGHNRHHNIQRLFVFGDSYADTGNTNTNTSESWFNPYGITFPSKPSGRFSDGRTFTDFLASFLGLEAPIAYRHIKGGGESLKYGVNFAFGGAGVFDTTVTDDPYPNSTTQIDFFDRLLKDSIVTPSELEQSLVHLSLAGNDYSTYLDGGGSLTGLITFVPKVVKQLVKNIQRIQSLGVKRISVTGLQPLGCLPQTTVENSFKRCIHLYNKAVQYHNLLLQRAIFKLNNQTTLDRDHGSPIIIVDLYNAFLSVFKESRSQRGRFKFEEPLLKSCCTGITPDRLCGDVDKKGNKLYTLCPNRNSSFYWDDSHPTDAGWEALILVLQATLEELKH